MDKQFCLDCGNKIKRFVDKCPYCGFDYIEFNKPKKASFDDMVSETLKKELYTRKVKKANKKANKKSLIYSEEEILALGLYPKDECYKMSLISKILGKNKH